jgi:hypothetical protein
MWLCIFVSLCLLMVLGCVYFPEILLSMNRYYIKEKFLISIWKTINNKKIVRISTSLISDINIRKIGKAFYIKNKYNIWIKTDTDCRAEEGSNIGSFDISGKKTTVAEGAGPLRGPFSLCEDRPY